MTAVTDEMLIAYIDGELSREERAKVEAAVAADPELAERLSRHRAVGSLIHGAFSGIADEPAPARLLASLKPPAAVVSLEAARKTREAAATAVKPTRTRKPIDARWGALAAGLAVGIGLGVFAPRPQTGLIDSDLRARGLLAATLETGLAAEQKQGAPVRVGLTFRSRDGDWCRTFAAREGTAGVACRGADGWAVRLAERGPPPSDAQFRTAASASPTVMAAVEGMIAGAPVDAAGERKARAGSWR